jgi:hypothetical protein
MYSRIDHFRQSYHARARGRRLRAPPARSGPRTGAAAGRGGELAGRLARRGLAKNDRIVNPAHMTTFMESIIVHRFLETDHMVGFILPDMSCRLAA